MTNRIETKAKSQKTVKQNRSETMTENTDTYITELIRYFAKSECIKCAYMLT